MVVLLGGSWAFLNSYQMIYQTRLWHFYWERLGYENKYLSNQFANAQGIPASTTSTISRRHEEVKSSSGLQKETTRN